MTTMTDSEALAVLDEVSEYIAERADVKDGDYGQPEPNTEMTLHVELRQARAHIAEALRDAEIGRKWREDSSLETWFPFTAEKLQRCEADAERYRWLRGEGFDRPAHMWVVIFETKLPIVHTDLDIAIDAAMKDKE